MNLKEIFFGLINSEIFGVPFVCSDEISDEMIKSLFALAKNHDIQNIISEALLNNKIIPKDNLLLKTIERQPFFATLRYERMYSDLLEVKEAFNDSNIEFVVLKGAVIRNLYPEPQKRTSADTDILVKEGQFESAKDILISKLGFTIHKYSLHDITLYSKSNTNFELHYDLVEKEILPKANIILKDAFSYVERQNNSEFRFSNEFFLFYHLSHIAKHVKTGGIGIKQFIDLKLIISNTNIDREKYSQLLETSELSVFNNECINLIDYWFSNVVPSNNTLQFENYIFKSGTYGTKSNRISINNSKKCNKFFYLISRLWLPYGELVCSYPKLKGKKALQPLYELKRIFDILFVRKNKKYKQELKILKKISKEQGQNINSLFKNIGLK